MYMPCVKCACSELKLAKNLHNFLHFDIKLKKSRSGFDLVTPSNLQTKLFSTPRLACLAR